MEACGSSHHWARELQKRGYKVKLMAAPFVKPYVKSNKNDHVDAEAIGAAMSRPNRRFVTEKVLSKERLLGISKRKDPYLRKLLVHGARAVIRHAKHREDPLITTIAKQLLLNGKQFEPMLANPGI